MYPEYSQVFMFDSLFLYLINYRFCGNEHLCILFYFERKKIANGSTEQVITP